MVFLNSLGGSAPGVYSMTGDDDDLNQYTVTPIDSRQYLPDGSLKQSVGAAGLTNFSWTPLGELNVLHRDAASGSVRLESTHSGSFGVTESRLVRFTSPAPRK